MEGEEESRKKDMDLLLLGTSFTKCKFGKNRAQRPSDRFTV
jgi:hypothetical protein